MYGLLLLAAAPGAAAVESMADVGKYRIEPATQTRQSAALATLQGLLVLRSGADNAPDASLDTVTVQVPGSGGDNPQFRVTAARIAGADGVGFDLPAGDFGEFQLSLQARKSAELSAWSLGGQLDVTVAASRRRHIALVPTLRINEMHGREIRYLAFEASLQGGEADTDPKFAFKWRI
ncbi:MAG: hypothetical protein ACT4PK_00485 [Gammaproteobacteria bacterium]